jgi:hypothetical protein
MSFARVTYPPPPPTSNTLTLHERNQFVRSTKKIGTVLGSTPHMVDGSFSMSMCYALPASHMTTYLLVSQALCTSASPLSPQLISHTSRASTAPCQTTAPSARDQALPTHRCLATPQTPALPLHRHRLPPAMQRLSILQTHGAFANPPASLLPC